MNARLAPERYAGEDWAGAVGDKWLANLDRFEGMIAPAGAALMAHAAFQPGERVIDIGCGAGGTTLEIAQAVGASGAVVGLDISPPLIAEAKRRAQLAGRSVDFIVGDAAAAQPPGAPFDRLFSRFGTMFFPDFPGAFANLRAMIRPDGRADLATWAPVQENPWMAQVLAIISARIDLPRPAPRAPGPFALDDSGFVEELLTSAGFVAVELTKWQGEQLVGGAGADPARASDFILGAFMFADAVEQLEDDVREDIRAELLDLFGRYHGPGGVRVPAAAWLITARC